ncbi:hypothetical protein CYMTET_42184 [Cymbomonas tetramitiformis]|uniref:Origin recognition complex subunit 4 C-terminal domain-containing protein n=1 Tax=Cymbomonas tetramitiformis TaxID=36881 RepID=A0AAE0F189_9CHLO|nr:hypothetical protein CYMTET_42184 [Cymbomonas tetramitiformis]
MTWKALQLDGDVHAMRELYQSEKALVVILDEFDLFAEHPKQALLYTLLNSLHFPHSRSMIVGVTSIMDAVDRLEKRVKSRFSFRKLVFTHRADDQAVVMRLLRHIMLVPELSSCDADERQVAAMRDYNLSVRGALEAPEVVKAVFKHAQLQLVPQRLCDLASTALARMHKDAPGPTSEDMLWAVANQGEARDSMAAILQGSSVLDLTLMVAMHRLRDFRDQASASFTQVLGESHNMFGTAPNLVATSGWEVALRSWENMVAMEVLEEATSVKATGRHGLLQFRQMAMLVPKCMLEAVLAEHQQVPSNLKVLMRREAT